MAFRAILMLPPLCMSAEKACSFTPHSWRHLLITAARQLGFNDDAQRETGHWSMNSTMPRVYGSASCTVELMHKSQFMKAFHSIWRVAQAGAVPEAEPKLDNADSIPPMEPVGADSEKVDSMVAPSRIKVVDTKVVANRYWVLNSGTKRVHLFPGNNPACTSSGRVRPGTPEEPFAGSIFRPCQTVTKFRNALMCRTCLRGPIGEALQLEEPSTALKPKDGEGSDADSVVSQDTKLPSSSEPYYDGDEDE